MKSRTVLSVVGQAASGGLLAGAFVGASEVLLLATVGGNDNAWQALFWAILAYGLLGLLIGLALGIVFAVLRRSTESLHAYALAFATVFAGLGLFITRYRLYRDLFHEGIRTASLQGLIFNGALLAGFTVVLLALLWLWRRPTLGSLRRAWRSLVVFAAVLAVAAAVSLLTRSASTLTKAPAGIPPGLEGAPNVILIGIDTLRADRLSSYGYIEFQTPHMDGLASDGVRYEEMTAQASWTKPSFATIFTSLYPSSHTATGKPHRLPQAVITLAEALAASGYHTGAFANNPSISPAFGFDQGFYDYVYLEPDYLFAADEAASQMALYQVARRAWAMLAGRDVYPQHFYQEASVVNRHALAWLEANRSTRFFLFLHYMDPHDPYFEHPFNGTGYARASNQNPDPALAPTFSELYDGEVRYLDDHLGQLFDWLRAEGLYDDSLIVLTSDHGEEFQEHGGWWHGQTLYQEQIAVPLIIKYPGGWGAGSVVTDLARSLDIAPTILEAAGVPIPATMMGRRLRDASEPPSYAFAEEDHEGNVLQSLRTASHKLILANPDNPRGLPAQSLFDLQADPGEHRDLLPDRPELVGPLQESLRQVLLAALEKAVDSEVGALDPNLQDKLHDLGY